MRSTAGNDKASIINNLLEEVEIIELTKEIAYEFQNLNTFPFCSFPQYLEPGIDNHLSLSCKKLFQLTKKKIDIRGFHQRLLEEEECGWVKNAVWLGTKDGKHDWDAVAMQLCMSLIQMKFRQLDNYIRNLDKTYVTQKYNLNVNKHYLVELSDPRLIIKNHGIIIDNEVLIYPHQFLRRYYSANFVGMPAMLRIAKDRGYQVYVRIDPFRETTSDHYQEIMEFDHWHGPPFSNKLLTDLYANTRTVHKSNGYYSLSYEADTTIFRTKMMDKSIREFMIEEYVPLELPFEKRSPGIGDTYCIQKFAHMCFDQSKNFFTHIDGAVRVFKIGEYEHHFHQIKLGKDVSEKIGERHKLFLVEGEIDKQLSEQLVTEWFRYNPHIQEYFSGTRIRPLLTYEDLSSTPNVARVF